MTWPAIVMLAPHARRVGGAETHLLDVCAELAADGADVCLVHRSAGSEATVSSIEAPTTDDVLAELAKRPEAVVHVHDNALDRHALQAVRAAHRVVHSFHNTSFACSSGTHLLNGHPCLRAHGPACAAWVGARRCLDRPNPLPALRRWREIGPDLEDARNDAATILYSEYASGVAVRNGFDPMRCHALPYFVRPKVPTPPPGDSRACFAGRLTNVKGLDVLLRAMARVPSLRRLDVVGDGYARGDLEQLAQSVGVADRTTFHGWQTPERIGEVMTAADVVVVPSTWPEPFGIVGLEAMALARPVIGSRTGGIPEWLTDGVTGTLVDPGSIEHLAKALAELLSDLPAAAALGQSGWERVHDFSPESHLRRLSAVYASVVR